MPSARNKLWNNGNSVIQIFTLLILSSFSLLSSFHAQTQCNDPLACNFNPAATTNDGSCDFCSCGGSGGFNFTTTHSQYSLEIETVAVHTIGDLAGLTTYRLFLKLAFPDDATSSFTGNDIFPLSLSTTTNFYQEPIFGGPTPSNSSSFAFAFIPNLEFDSWVTIGLSGPAGAGESNTSILPGTWATSFENGNSFTVNDGIGSGWYVMSLTALNVSADATQRILFAQLTTDGDISGSFKVQIFPHGDNSFDNRVDFTFSMTSGNPANACGCMSILACNYDPLANYDDGSCDFASCFNFGCTDVTACNYDPIANSDDGSCSYPATFYDCFSVCINDTDGDGVCDELEVLGCTDINACNYDSLATDEDGSCTVLDECGVCGGTGIPLSDCDCNGNQLDALGVCGGSCPGDSDGDGICDTVDNCVGVVDALGVCAGNCLEDLNSNLICDIYESGCTDPSNPNYDSSAIFDDGSCMVGGCTFITACNYNPLALYQIVGACDFLSCAGCMDATACNYDPTATVSSESCLYASSFYDCSGNCLNDSDGDGECDEFEVDGCTNAGPPNYNPYATNDDGSCLVGGCTIPTACNFNVNANYLIPADCDFITCVGCNDVNACNYDPGASIPNLFLCIYPTIFLDCFSSCNNDSDGDFICDELEIPGCTDPTSSNYNPDATEDNFTCQPIPVGGCILPFACNYDPAVNFYIPGSCIFSPCGGMPPSDVCTQYQACNFGAAGPCEFLSCLALGCNNAGACNFDPSAAFNDGSCEYLSCIGCQNPTACDYDPTASISGACYDFESCIGCLDSSADNYSATSTQNGGICIYLGCTIAYACNFNPVANSDDGTCDFNSCSGCMIESACDFNPDAIIASSCSFPAAGFDCAGNCVGPDCANAVIPGCIDVCACNYEPSANADNGSCAFNCLGCIYETASNYDLNASRDDGSCVFVGCTDANFYSYNPVANTSGQCNSTPISADFNNDGIVQVEDLAIFLQAFSTEGPDWSGITWISSSCNVTAYAASDLLDFMLGAVGMPEAIACGTNGCSYPGALNYDPNAVIDTGLCLFGGCTDSSAFNFDHLSNIDDGTCRYSVCPDFNGDGQIQIVDLMDFLLLWGQ